MTRIKSALQNRISNHVDILLGALHFNEGRSEDEIIEAVTLFERWAINEQECGDEFYSSYLLEIYIECCVDWADRPSRFLKDFPATTKTCWHLQEFHLVASLYLADKAFSHFCSKHRDSRHLVAMLYADSVELHLEWLKTRGPGKSRNPNQRFVEIERILRGFDSRSEIRARAKYGARKRLEKDPKQHAKTLTKEFWLEWKSGKHPSIRTVERFAIEAMRRTPVLVSANVIRRWSANWSRELKSREL